MKKERKMLGETDRQPQTDTAGIAAQETPVDLAHLARQTFGDAALEQEVLGMFADQLEEAVERLPRAALGERQHLAHGLVGAARGVGAFRLADCVAEIEIRPGEEAAIARFAVLAGEVRAFIAVRLR